MRFLIAPLLLASLALAADVQMNVGAHGYNFGYNTGEGHSRSESGSGGVVAGSYSYVDANGDQRTVHYTAGPDGFKPTGDIGVDRKTAAAADAINALAPKAPLPVAPVAPVAPVHHHYGNWWGHPAPVTYFHPGLHGFHARW